MLATGHGVFELTGFSEERPDGPRRRRGARLSDADAGRRLVREWGVRQLEQQLSLRTRAGIEKNVTADFFPAYDDDGGLLVALTPR